MATLISESQAKEYVAHFRCSCGSDLDYTIGGRNSSGERLVQICCVENRTHHETVRRESLAELEEEGRVLVPPYIQYNIDKKRRTRMEQEYGTGRAATLAKYESVISLTEPEAMKVLRLVYPKAPDMMIQSAAILCAQYSLNPLKKHVYILGPFTDHDTQEQSWSLVQSIGSKRLLARREARKRGTKYDYEDFSPRIMTDEEQKKIRGHLEPENIWFITILNSPEGRVYGTGFWPRDKKVKGADKGNTKENMAAIHSESQALDRLFPSEMPNVGVIDERFEGEEKAQDAAYSEVKEAAAAVSGGGDASSAVPPNLVASIKTETPPMMDRQVFLNIAKKQYGFDAGMVETFIKGPLDKYSEPYETILDELKRQQHKEWRARE